MVQQNISRRRQSVPYRLLQAVGLAALTTCLVALYLRQERVSARHLAYTRRLVHDRELSEGVDAVKQDRANGAQQGTKAAIASKPLPEPWGTHHMLKRKEDYEKCPANWIEGTWTSSRSMGSVALPLSVEAQREIYEHQNPKDCSKAKYLVYSIQPNGIGAVFHVTGVALQIALDSGRIFIESPGTFLTKSPKCGVNNTLDSCYFVPFSKCRPTEAQLRGAVGMRPMDVPDDTPVVTVEHEAIIRVRAQAPLRFQARLNATSMDPDKQYYWWRAMSVAYMIRPNAQTLAELERRREKYLAGPAPAPGCISIHVRHGDKGVEAETFEDQVYDKTATELRALDPDRFTDQLYVSTEDPDTISYFVNGTSSTPDATAGAAGTAGSGRAKWRTGYTAGVPRKPNRNKANLSYMAEIGYYEEMLNSLLNLDLALECSAFVGSIFSNWVRLIDELRATVRCKADAVFADVHYKNPHEMVLNW